MFPLAPQVLEKFDAEKIDQRKHHNKLVLEEEEHFRLSYIKRAAAVHKHMDKKAKKEALIQWDTMTQDDAKKYLPPTGCTIWRGITRQLAWCGHCPPFVRMEEPFRRHKNDGMEALKVVLAALWAQWAEKHGLDKKKVCPYAEQLFGKDDQTECIGIARTLSSS